MNGSHSDYRGKLRCQNGTNAYGDSRAHSRRDEHHQNVHICVDEEGYDTIGEAGNICRDIQPRNNHSVRSRRRRTREQGYQKKKEVSVCEQKNVEQNKAAYATEKDKEEQRGEGAHSATHETAQNPNHLRLTTHFGRNDEQNHERLAPSHISNEMTSIILTMRYTPGAIHTQMHYILVIPPLPNQQLLSH